MTEKVIDEPEWMFVLAWLKDERQVSGDPQEQRDHHGQVERTPRPIEAGKEGYAMEVKAHRDTDGEVSARPTPKVGSYWKHRKGGNYMVIANGLMEADLTPAVVYRDIALGTTWVRPLSDFMDGRFEQVDVAPAGLTEREVMIWRSGFNAARG